MADKKADKDVLTVVAVGDIAPLRDDPGEVFNLTRDILKDGDITFGQLERILSERGTQQLYSIPATRGKPLIAKALSEAGFDVISIASNHTMDLSEEGLFDTLNVLRENNIKVIGAGKNIEEATQPAIFEFNGTRVGILSYCSVVAKGYEATRDRAGVAPVRAYTAYEQVDWQPGAPLGVLTWADPDDLAAMVEDIKKLRPSVDVLVVSQHWGVHFVPAIIAKYQYEVGHAAIDAGADIIIGHHPHILKGIEVYKGKVIFFSLGNFNYDTRPGRLLTSPYYKLYHWDLDPEYPRYTHPIDAQKTIMVKCTITDKKIQRVAFLPLWINKDVQPEPLSRSDPRSDAVYQYMQWLCTNQQLETKLSRDGDEVVVLT